VDDAAEEFIGQLGEAELALGIVEQVGLAALVPDGDVAWQPLPVRFRNGFGMKEARKPCFSAIDLTIYLKKAWRSAVVRQSSNSQFISNWPLASSWSFW